MFLCSVFPPWIKLSYFGHGSKEMLELKMWSALEHSVHVLYNLSFCHFSGNMNKILFRRETPVSVARHSVKMNKTKMMWTTNIHTKKGHQGNDVSESSAPCPSLSGCFRGVALMRMMEG